MGFVIALSSFMLGAGAVEMWRAPDGWTLPLVAPVVIALATTLAVVLAWLTARPEPVVEPAASDVETDRSRA